MTALTFVHEFMVDLGYAFMSGEINLFLLTADVSLAQELHREMQLLSGLAPLLENVLDEELCVASTVTVFDIFQPSFSHNLRVQDSCRAGAEVAELAGPRGEHTGSGNLQHLTRHHVEVLDEGNSPCRCVSKFSMPEHGPCSGGCHHLLSVSRHERVLRN